MRAKNPRIYLNVLQENNQIYLKKEFTLKVVLFL